MTVGHRSSAGQNGTKLESTAIAKVELLRGVSFAGLGRLCRIKKIENQCILLCPKNIFRILRLPAGIPMTETNVAEGYDSFDASGTKLRQSDNIEYGWALNGEGGGIQIDARYGAMIYPFISKFAQFCLCKPGPSEAEPVMSPPLASTS